MIILSFIHFFRVFYSLYSIQYFYYFFKSSFYYYSQYFSSIFFSIRYSTFSLLVLKFRSFQLSPFHPFILSPIFSSNVSLSPFLLDSQYSTIPFIFYTFLIRFFFNFPLSTRFQFHYFDNTFSTIPAFFLFYILPFRDILPQFHFLFPYIFFLHFYSTPFSLSTRYSVSPFLF